MSLWPQLLHQPRHLQQAVMGILYYRVDASEDRGVGSEDRERVVAQFDEVVEVAVAGADKLNTASDGIWDLLDLDARGEEAVGGSQRVRRYGYLHDDDGVIGRLCIVKRDLWTINGFNLAGRAVGVRELEMGGSEMEGPGQGSNGVRLMLNLAPNPPRALIMPQTVVASFAALLGTLDAGAAREWVPQVFRQAR